MNEPTDEQSRNHAMTAAELAELLKQPEARDAIRDVLIALAATNAFHRHPGLNLPGIGRR